MTRAILKDIHMVWNRHILGPTRRGGISRSTNHKAEVKEAITESQGNEGKSEWHGTTTTKTSQL